MICGLDDYASFTKTFRLLAQVLLSRYNCSVTVAAKADLTKLVNAHEEFREDLENDLEAAQQGRFDDSGR